MPLVRHDGRCTACLSPVDGTSVCQRCWPRSMSSAAEAVLSETERYYPPLPELITAHVAEDSIPVFHRLLMSVDSL